MPFHIQSYLWNVADRKCQQLSAEAILKCPELSAVFFLFYFLWADKNRSKVTFYWPFGAEHLGSVVFLLLRGFGRSRFDVDLSNLQEARTHTHKAKRRREGTEIDHGEIFSITVRSPSSCLDALAMMTSRIFISWRPTERFKMTWHDRGGNERSTTQPTWQRKRMESNVCFTNYLLYSTLPQQHPFKTEQN